LRGKSYRNKKDVKAKEGRRMTAMVGTRMFSRGGEFTCARTRGREASWETKGEKTRRNGRDLEPTNHLLPIFPEERDYTVRRVPPMRVSKPGEMESAG